MHIFTFLSRLSRTFAITFFLFIPALHAAPRPVNIGLSFPLSGPVAEFGEAARNGITLAQKEFPELFKGINFVYDDNQYSPSVAVSSFHKFQQKEHVEVLYVWGSAPCLAVASLADKFRLPTFCLSGDEKPNHPYVISFASPFADYAAPLARHAREQNYHSLAAVYTEIPFLTNLWKALKQAHVSTDKNKISLEEAVNPDITDFKSVITKIKQQQPQGLVLFLLPHQIGPFLQQMKSLGYFVPILGADTLASKEASKNGAASLESSVYVDMKVMPDFLKRYHDEFHTIDNAAFAANTYQFALLIAKLYGREDAPKKAEDLISALEQLEPIQGATGLYRYAYTKEMGHYFKFTIQLKRIHGGKSEVVFENE